MGEKERIEGVCRCYEEQIGGTSPYFKVKKKVVFCCFDRVVFEPPYDALSDFKEVQPQKSLVFTELQAIVSDMSSYQAVREGRVFADGSLHDSINVVLEEFKHWCHGFQVNRDLQVSITELDRRLRYVQALRAQELFSGRTWTRSDSESMGRVLYRTEQELIKAKEKLMREYQVTQLRDSLMLVEQDLQVMLGQSTYYLAFILRNTPGLSVNAGNIKFLQRKEESTKALRETLSGDRLCQLVRRSLVQQVMDAKRTHRRLAAGEISDRDRGDSDNHYLLMTEEGYELKERRVEELKRANLKSVGIEPLILKSHPEAVRNFLILHGLFYELARIQLAIQTTSALVSLGGQRALIRLYPLIQIITAYYQLVSDGIEKEMNQLNAVVTQVTDEKVVFKVNKVSDTWVIYQKRAREFVDPLLSNMRGVLEHLNQVARLSHSNMRGEVTEEMRTLVDLLKTQTRFMGRCFSRRRAASRSDGSRESGGGRASLGSATATATTTTTATATTIPRTTPITATATTASSTSSSSRSLLLGDTVRAPRSEFFTPPPLERKEGLRESKTDERRATCSSAGTMMTQLTRSGERVPSREVGVSPSVVINS